MVKFRAWDKVQNKMLLPDNIEFIHGQAYWAEASIGDNGSYSNDGKTDGIDALFELEQFTGLKDVNGKDIYVGDVVQPVRVIENCPELNNWISRVGKPFLVKNRNYVHGKWIARSVADKGFGVDDWNLGAELLIIGNVHENPELLEESYDN